MGTAAHVGLPIFSTKVACAKGHRNLQPVSVQKLDSLSLLDVLDVFPILEFAVGLLQPLHCFLIGYDGLQFFFRSSGCLLEKRIWLRQEQRACSPRAAV